MNEKEEFLQIFREKVQREGAEELLTFLEQKSDFFTAPASTKFHNAFEGGLCAHSLNVYHCLVDYLARPRVRETFGLSFSDESIAIAALLHDVCKINTYRPGTRNVKNEATGRWEQVATYYYDDTLPYGHGEKSVYIVSGFMRLSRDEAMAIRWHMGFSHTEESRIVGQALEAYPLAFAVSVADQEASFLMEKE